MKFKIKSLRKSIFTVLSVTLFLLGCEEIPSDIVETENSTYQITNVSAPGEIVLSGIDTTFSVSAEVKNSQNINSISARFYNPLNKFLEEIQLNISGIDDIQTGTRFTGALKLDSASENGKYKIEFYVDANQKNNLEAIHYLNFDDGKSNQPPVLIDSTLTAPDSIKIPEQIQNYLITIKVEDPQGLNDIAEVYIDYFFPDNFKINIEMYDDGINGGDQVANDGIYSIRFMPTEDPRFIGANRLEILAIDRKNQISNKVVHNIVIYK